MFEVRPSMAATREPVQVTGFVVAQVCEPSHDLQIAKQYAKIVSSKIKTVHRGSL